MACLMRHCKRMRLHGQRSKTDRSYSRTYVRVTGHFDRLPMIFSPLNQKTTLPLWLEQYSVESR